jgi:hypothetical protein
MESGTMASTDSSFRHFAAPRIDVEVRIEQPVECDSEESTEQIQKIAAGAADDPYSNAYSHVAQAPLDLEFLTPCLKTVFQPASSGFHDSPQTSSALIARDAHEIH